MTYPRLTYKDGEGVAKVPDAFREIDPGIRMDLLQHWIIDLQDEYNRAYEAAYPRSAIAKAEA